VTIEAIGAAEPCDPVESHPSSRRWLVLGVMCLSLVIISLSNTSLNVALPTLADELDASPAGLQWIVASYSLVFAGLLLSAGALGDRYGRRLALNVGLAIFGLASALAALCTTTAQLVVARGAMGVGAALIMPATLSVIAHVFPQEERTRAVAIWAGFSGAGGAAGSVLSGWLLEHYWWGSIFLGNVVVAAVALVAGAILVPPSRDAAAPRLDPFGVVLSIAAMTSLVYVIIRAPDVGWFARETALGLVGAGSLLAAFLWWEWRASSPMLDLGLFRERAFVGAALTITTIFFVMYGTIFVLTQVLQSVEGYSPFEAGLRTLPMPVAFMLAAPQSARMVVRWGLRKVVCAGMLLLATGATVLAIAAGSGDYPIVALGLVAAAVGMGMTTAPSTGAIMYSVPLSHSGVASAINDTTRELGSSLGVAVLGAVLTASYQSELGAAGATDLVSSSASAVGASAESLGVAALAHAAQVTLVAAAVVSVLGALAMRRLLPRRLT
jgi:EmrB/QacA subfamily drug resistance transporter